MQKRHLQMSANVWKKKTKAKWGDLITTLSIKLTTRYDHITRVKTSWEDVSHVGLHTHRYKLSSWRWPPPPRLSLKRLWAHLPLYPESRNSVRWIKRQDYFVAAVPCWRRAGKHMYCSVRGVMGVTACGTASWYIHTISLLWLDF